MNQGLAGLVDYGSSSDSEVSDVEQRKPAQVPSNSKRKRIDTPTHSTKKVQIHVDLSEIVSNDDVGTVQEEEKPLPSRKGPVDLFSLLPAPKNQNKKSHDKKDETEDRVLGGGIRGDGQQAMIDIPKALKKKTQKKSPIPEKAKDGPKPSSDLASPSKAAKKEAEEDSFDFFSLETEQVEEEDLTGPMVGPSLPQNFKSLLGPSPKPSSTTSIYRVDHLDTHTILSEPSIAEDVVEVIPEDVDELELARMGYKRKNGPISFVSVNQMDQLGDSHERQVMKEASLEGLEQASSFAKLRPGFVANEGMKRRHNIMSLVYEAKAREAAMLEEQAQRKALQKLNRAKYGF